MSFFTALKAVINNNAMAFSAGAAPTPIDIYLDIDWLWDFLIPDLRHLDPNHTSSE